MTYKVMLWLYRDAAKPFSLRNFCLYLGTILRPGVYFGVIRHSSTSINYNSLDDYINYIHFLHIYRKNLWWGGE